MTELDSTEGQERATGTANAALRRSLDDAPIGLCYLDADLRFVHINEWLDNVNGLSVEAHIGKTIREVLPHDVGADGAVVGLSCVVLDVTERKRGEEKPCWRVA